MQPSWIIVTCNNNNSPSHIGETCCYQQDTTGLCFTCDIAEQFQSFRCFSHVGSTVCYACSFYETPMFSCNFTVYDLFSVKINIHTQTVWHSLLNRATISKIIPPKSQWLYYQSETGCLCSGIFGFNLVPRWTSPGKHLLHVVEQKRA